MEKIYFMDASGTFSIRNPENYSALYFPIAGEKGLKSSVTPNLGGDSKLDQETFLLEPVSSENLHNNRSTRNFWCIVENVGCWSATGASAEAENNKFTDSQDYSELSAGFMWHTMHRVSRKYQLASEITSFVPVEENTEILYVKIRNTAETSRKITPVAAIPVYGRSADNIRDHRNVTSMLHRIRTSQYGVLVKPTMSFDEKGHRRNHSIYFVEGVTGKGEAPVSFYPTVDSFIGEGGTYTHPRAIYQNGPGLPEGTEAAGREAMGALRFEAVVLEPGETAEYVILGFGLSYTSFAIKFRELRIKETEIEADVTVENTGNRYAGREVIQLYVTLPQSGEVKEYHRLAGFAKTSVLQPGETQNITVTVKQKQLACFSAQTHAWIVEKGDYGLWIGNQSASLQLAAVLAVPKQVNLERVDAVCSEEMEFEELSMPEYAEKEAKKWSEMARTQNIPKYVFIPQEEERKIHKSCLVPDQPVSELIPLLYGNITMGASTLGSAGIRVPGSAGETSEALEKKYGIRSLIMADGPAGIRLRQSYEVDRATDQVYGVGVLGSLENGYLESTKQHENADTYYQYCTAFPVGTALAQTWDQELMQKFGEAVAEEMEEFQVDLWLAPGMNIQRNPLCGRNFEYYSEDPLLSGVLAAAVTTGVQSRKGCGVTIKHFACNNQEDNRMGVDSRVSERTLREIYFRGFEIAIKESAPIALMTSYNLINGIHSANRRDLCTTLAREEWGFEGVIMSDWNTTVPEDGSVPWKCVAAGNDIIMPGSPKDDRNIREAYADGLLSEEEIRSCAGRILSVIERLALNPS